jgi:phage terminase small subunit
MARASAASLATVSVLPGQRMEPPLRLLAEASAIWREVVATKPSDWFNADSSHLLEAYCHAVVSHRLVSKSVMMFTDEALAQVGGPKQYELLTRMQERQTRVIATIATKLRLTQQSRYTPQAAATASKKVSGGGSRPWDA